MVDIRCRRPGHRRRVPRPRCAPRARIGGRRCGSPALVRRRHAPSSRRRAAAGCCAAGHWAPREQSSAGSRWARSLAVGSSVGDEDLGFRHAHRTDRSRSTVRASATRGRCCATTPLGAGTGGAGADLPGLDGARRWWRTRAWSTAGRPAACAASAPTTTPARSSNARASRRPTSLAWLRRGRPRTCCRRWRYAPADLDVLVFLKGVPGPGEGWAGASATRRRSTRSTPCGRPRLGHLPPGETWIHAELPPRRGPAARSGSCRGRGPGWSCPSRGTVVVRTTDTRQAWTLRVGDGRTTSQRRASPRRARPTTWRSPAPRPRSTSPPGTAATRATCTDPDLLEPVASRRAGALVARPSEQLDWHVDAEFGRHRRLLVLLLVEICPRSAGHGSDEVALEDRPEPAPRGRCGWPRPSPASARRSGSWPAR